MSFVEHSKIISSEKASLVYDKASCSFLKVDDRIF